MKSSDSRLRSGTTRRAFLGGAGVAIALPFLESFVPGMKLARGDTPPAAKRLVYLVAPDGAPETDYPGTFRPSKQGSGYDMTPCLQPIADNGLQGDVFVLSGLSNAVATDPGDDYIQSTHERADPSLLSGAAIGYPGDDKCNYPTNTNLTTVDQLAAYGANGVAGIGKNTPAMPSLELSLNDSGWCTMDVSWRAGAPLSRISRARAAFNALFAGFNPGATQAETARRNLYRKSVLDYALSEANSLQARVSVADRARLDHYFTSVRDLEQRVGAGAAVSCAPGAAPPDLGTDDGSIQARAKQMLDLIVLAFRCDRTRVATLLLEDSVADPVYAWAGAPTGAGWHNGVIHNASGLDDATRKKVMINVVSWEVAQLCYLAKQLKGIDEGGTSVLDNSAIVLTSQFGSGNGHWLANLPVVVAGRLGGALNPGRHLVYGNPSDALGNAGRPLADLHLTLLQGLGLGVSSFGVSTGPLSLA